MKVMGFVNNSPIDSILSVSDSFMLFYLEEDKNDDDIRAVNHTKYAEFFDMNTGNPISISGLLNFELVNSTGNVIFSSDKVINDDDLVIQYGFIKAKLEDQSEIN